MWWSRALSSFSDELLVCNVFSRSTMSAPSLSDKALRWTPLTLPRFGAAFVDEEGSTAED